MITLFINNTKIKVPDNTTVLQACNLLNINIPKFCFNENLQIAGNCRMCLVEIENSPKPVVSCSMPVLNNMKVFTNSSLVKKARETVLEFLLINHPLDCPICDQGGECDLQDQTMVYGVDKSRHFYFKRTVENKNCSPFIKTIMTRCIHCTKCVRFSQEIGNIDELGTIGRGNKMEISFYLQKIFNSEFSANVVDLCPVGALTLKPYAFKTRLWELRENETLDLLDSLVIKIIIQTKNNNIIRVLPKMNKKLSMEWITNKTRFFFDSVNYQRLEFPLLKKNGKFIKIPLEVAFQILLLKTHKIDCSNKKAIVGEFIGIKELFLFKHLSNLFGIKQLNFNQSHYSNENSDIANQFLYLNFFRTLKNSNLCLLINYNPRIDCSLLNLKLKNFITQNNLEIYSVGSVSNLTYKVNNLGLLTNTLIKIIEGKHKFCKKILKSKNFTIIIGSDIYHYKNICFSTYLTNRFNNNLNVLIIKPSFINYLEVSNNKINKDINAQFLLMYNTDLPNSKIKFDKKNKFLIYFGHHFNKNAQMSDLLLPTLTFLEKKNSYLNFLGKIQQTNQIKTNKTQIKNDINLFSNFLKYLKKNKKNFNIGFNKLFIHINQDKIQKIDKMPINVDSKNFSNVNLNILKLTDDKFFPKNVFEKTSKILMSALIKFKKYSLNFNI